LCRLFDRLTGYAHMNSTNLITRVAQWFFAAMATGVSLVVLQIAMLA
jgi:hypothetical protein